MEKRLWNFVAGDKLYTASTRNQLKKKRKALRSNPTFAGEVSEIVPITFNTETGEARMPILYVAKIKRDKNAGS